MPKKRLALLVAVAAAALVLGVVGLVVTVAWLRAEPDCAQVREDRIDEESYERLEELARFTEALAVLEHAHKQYRSLAEARKLTDEFERLPVLRVALAHCRKNAPPEPDEKAPPSMQSRILGATYVALNGFPKRLATAMAGGDRGLVARTAKTGADLLTNVAEYLGKGTQSPPKAVVDARQLVQAEIEALSAVRHACGHCGDPKADR
ncbi:MAG: hypothetical protein JW889_12980, partial [Verrucomicrobia bacterium]|nr:hypothetical protein [Verrucomicrobiota bacterium]